MGKALRKLVNENGGSAKALRDLEWHGQRWFCEHWEVTAATAERWLREQEGYSQANIYSFTGRTTGPDGQITARDIVSEFTLAIKELLEKCKTCKAQQDCQLKLKDNRIAELEWEVKKRREIDRGVVEPFLDAVQEAREKEI